jgi:phosphomevalonate kinase
MTDLAGRQFNSGDSEEASETIMLVQRYAEKIHMDISEDSKKLKSAELLMQRTTFRLKDMLHEVSYEDQMTVAVTLKQLNQVQAHLMLQVFEK